MQPSSRALLSPLLLLIFAGSTGAFSSRQGECTFPQRWEGSWFQSGVRQPIVISKNELSSKGRCLHNDGDKFLLVDQKSCYRCVVIHEKHSNVLQYKETYCHNKNSLSSLCSYITGDALLYSMFREVAPPVACPFRGPMTFSYNRGHGTCSSPQSNVDTCTDDSRLLFRYQACPDVSASESAVEELECLATWKEGSSRYLVGRLHHNHASSNEDRYRCFVYEKASQTVQQGNLNRAAMGIGAMDHDVALPSGPMPEGAAEIYRVAQSGDATCNGLFSPMEGSRTMTLKKVSSPGECRFPSWLTGHSSGGLTWHTLDLARSYTFHPRNASLRVDRSNSSSSRLDGGSLDGQYVPGQEDQDMKILCNSIKQTSSAQATTMTMLVAHFTVGCRSGYMCMAFYRRDGHVIEVQTGNAVSRPEEACSPPHFQQRSIPYLTLVTSSPESRQCPYLGKFTVTGVNRNQRNIRESRRNQQHQESLSSRREVEKKVRHALERTEDRRGRKMDFDLDKRRANNEYLVHERMGRRARSNRNSKSHRSTERQGESASTRILASANLGDLLREQQQQQRPRVKTRKNSMDLDGRSSESLEELAGEEGEGEGEKKKKNEEKEENQKEGEKQRKEDKNERNEMMMRMMTMMTTTTTTKKRRTLESSEERSRRSRRTTDTEDFQVDADDFAQIRQFWQPDFDDAGLATILEVDGDYFGEYPDTEGLPKKRSSYSRSSYHRKMREGDEDEEVEEEEEEEEDGDVEEKGQEKKRKKKKKRRDSASLRYSSFFSVSHQWQPLGRRTRRDLERQDGFLETPRGKREEVDSRCNSDVTTLTVGCSNADRMEFQSDCVDDDAVTAYSCHGRWFDAEGTQFVIATPLARGTSWSNDNNRPQPYRESRRFCFMYKESGGVVSLTASPIACQRGIPPPTMMLAFNATSTGHCIEENGSTVQRATYLTVALLSTAVVAIFR